MNEIFKAITIAHDLSKKIKRGNSDINSWTSTHLLTEANVMNSIASPLTQLNTEFRTRLQMKLLSKLIVFVITLICMFQHEFPAFFTNR